MLDQTENNEDFLLYKGRIATLCDKPTNEIHLLAAEHFQTTTTGLSNEVITATMQTATAAYKDPTDNLLSIKLEIPERTEVDLAPCNLHRPIFSYFMKNKSH